MGVEAPTMEARQNGRRAIVTRGLVGVALGAASGTGFWLSRRLRRRKAQTRAPAPLAVLRVVPARVRESAAHVAQNGNWKPWAIAAGGVALAVTRLIELRRLGRLSKALSPASA